MCLQFNRVALRHHELETNPNERQHRDGYAYFNNRMEKILDESAEARRFERVLDGVTSRLAGSGVWGTLIHHPTVRSRFGAHHFVAKV